MKKLLQQLINVGYHYHKKAKQSDLDFYMPLLICVLTILFLMITLWHTNEIAYTNQIKAEECSKELILWKQSQNQHHTKPYIRFASHQMPGSGVK